MNRFFIACGAALAVLTAGAVTPGAVTVDDASGRVTVPYTLDAPAVVTFDVQTNSGSGWVSIGLDKVTCVAGDVNRLVDSTAGSVVWMPRSERTRVSLSPGMTRYVLRAWSADAPPDYLVLNLAVKNVYPETGGIPSSEKIRYYEDVSQLPGGIDGDIYRTDSMVFRKIPARNVVWKMGSGADRRVVLTNDYYMAVFETTQAQARSLAGWSEVWRFAAYTNNACRPVDHMVMPCYDANGRGLRYPFNWPSDDYVKAHTVNDYCFIGKARAHSGWGIRLDLPTEAQWEFAARAGSGGYLPDGSPLTVRTGGEDVNVSRFARYKHNGGYAGNGTVKPSVGCTADNATAVVGSYLPNRWGLYDVLGNVYEWCLDSFGSLASGCVTNPVGASASNNHVLRGGAYVSEPESCTLMARTKYNYWIESMASLVDYNGFRLCLTLPPPPPAPEGAVTRDDFAEVKNPGDPTNGGFWDLSAHVGTAVKEAYAFSDKAVLSPTETRAGQTLETPFVSMVRTCGYSAPGALNSGPVSLYLIVR